MHTNDPNNACSMLFRLKCIYIATFILPVDMSVCATAVAHLVKTSVTYMHDMRWHIFFSAVTAVTAQLRLVVFHLMSKIKQPYLLWEKLHKDDQICPAVVDWFCDLNISRSSWKEITCFLWLQGATGCSFWIKSYKLWENHSEGLRGSTL